MKKVYLDNNATTEVHPEVLEAMLPFFREKYGNPSSVHSFGRDARKHLEESRRRVAALVGADSPEEIVFTSGGTESDNFAVKGVALALKEKGKHIITSAAEHSAVLNTCSFLEERGFRVTYLGVDQYGIIDPDELKERIADDTILVSIMTANNETGTVMPVEEVGRICEEKRVLFHTDAVQVAGKIPFDVNKAKAHLVSVSAHKLYGPKGSGAVYIRKGTEIAPYQHGGHHEKNRRAGTENIPGIVGLGKACEIASGHGLARQGEIKKLKSLLYDGIKAEVNVSFQGLEGESLVMNLDLEGIAVATGAACTSGSTEPSHVLKAMGAEAAFLQGSVRFSLGIFNTKDEINYVIKKLLQIIRSLKKTNKE